MSLSRAVEEGSLPTRFSPAADALAAARAIEAARFTECAANRRDSLREERARAERERFSRDRYEARPIRSETPGAPGSSAPILYVRLLGGLDVRIGEQQVDMQAFSRQKTKTLLALLVLARIPASACWDALARQPPRLRNQELLLGVEPAKAGGSTTRARAPISFATRVVFALTLGCEATLPSDSICRAFELRREDLERWRDHLEAIDGSYSGDLLPSESVNDDIAAARRRLRINLVDSLVCASGRLLESGEPRAALWFAREAAGRDRARTRAPRSWRRSSVSASAPPQSTLTSRAEGIL